jgi:hypothetical protein
MKEINLWRGELKVLRVEHLQEIPHQGHQVHHRGSQGRECDVREEGLPLTAAAEPKQCNRHNSMRMKSEHIQPWKISNGQDS